MHKTAKSKPTSNKMKEEICFTSKMNYFCNNLIRAKKVDKVFLAKQQTNLVKTW